MNESNYNRSSFSAHFDGTTADPAFRGTPPFVERFVGIIRGGPASAGRGADYADARYYVDLAIPAATSTAKAKLTTNVDSLAGVKETITATNLAELADQTHLLVVGTNVQVFALHARGGDEAKVHVFYHAPETSAVVQITSAAGSGAYNGKILSGSATASESSACSMPSGMVIPAVDNALILNEEESSLPGNRLKNNSFAVGVIRGMTTDTPPRSIVVLRGGVGRTDSPTIIGTGSSGSESPDTATWDRSTDGTPVNVILVSRVVYNASGDKTLYSFVRTLSFDARGLLVNVGGETRVTVDVTEACG